MFSIRRVLASGMLLLAGLASPAIAAPAKVTIGFPPATDFLAAYVAKDKGFFAKHDIDATMTLIPVVNNIPSAIVSGSVQIGMSTIPTLLQAVDGGLDLKIVAGAARHIKEQPFISLLARTGVEYSKPSDLIGKKVGVPGINSVIDVMLRKWLINNNVPINAAPASQCVERRQCRFRRDRRPVPLQDRCHQERQDRCRVLRRGQSGRPGELLDCRR